MLQLQSEVEALIGNGCDTFLPEVGDMAVCYNDILSDVYALKIDEDNGSVF